MKNLSQDDFELALRRCEAEPIHHVGKIQPHGALLVLGLESPYLVLQCSENLADFIDLPVNGVLGKTLENLLDHAALEQLVPLMQAAGEQHSVSGRICVTWQQKRSDLTVRLFVSASAYVIELVRSTEEYATEHLSGLLRTVQRSLLALSEDTDSYHYFQQVACVVRELTSFERVMVYRFDSNWDGEVIAESREESVHSYLGSRFPASDIPPQARRLYTRNPVRQIADTEAVPVAIVPELNPLTMAPLDMTFSVLRSLSPVHIEYLRNMGVRASMSISLLQNGRLWGLIACHHREPKQVSNAVQEAGSFLSQIVSSKLSLLEVHEWRNLGMEASRIVGALLKNITIDTEEAIYRHLLPDLLDLLDASGVIMVVEGRRYVYGDLPSHADTEDLILWLSTQSAAETVSCNHLGERFPSATRYAEVASGLLATPLSEAMNNCIIWLRKEKLRTVHWAGRPEKIFHEDAAGVRLSPRKSFEAWQEIWRGRSAPWSHIEVETAKSIALALTQGLAQKAQLELAQAEKKRVDEALREVSQYRAFFENSPIAVHLVNVASQSVMLANQRFAELTGVDMAKIAGTDPKQYYAKPQDYGAVLAELASGRPVTNVLVQIRVRGSSEGERWVLASCQQLSYQNAAAVLVWFYDISELKRAEEALLITASVFANIQEAVLIADANGTIIDVNPAFSTITGYARDEAVGNNPRMLSSGRHNKEFYAAMWGALKSQKSWRGEIWNKRKSGEHYAEMLSISVVQDNEGKVLRYVAVFSDITHLKAHEAELRRIAHYDALTGIPNRALLVDRMRQAIAQTLREKNLLAVCYLDLDGFKSINDTLGHEAGDQVLIDTASRIGNSIRGGDTVARLGGDEFVVLLPGLSHVDECVPTLERLLTEIATPISFNGCVCRVSASIGVSILVCDNETPDTLLNRADQAMYKAKQSGKDRYWIYGEAGGSDE